MHSAPHLRKLCIVAIGALIASLGQLCAAETAQVADRVTFEMALSALRDGELPLARQILEGLIEQTDEGPERKVYEALLAGAEGRADEGDASLRSILEAVPQPEFSQAWVYDELVRRVAALRLAHRRRDAEKQLEEVLAKHYEARGGLDRLQAVTDITATGRMVVGGQELPFRLARKWPRFYRLDVTTPRGLEVTATDGRTAWYVSAGSETPVRLEGPAASELVDQSYFDDVLVRFHETGDRLFLAGKEKRGGSEVLRIEVEPKRGNRQVALLDAHSYLEVERWVYAAPSDQPVRIAYEYTESGEMPMIARQTVHFPGGRAVAYVFDTYVVDRPIDPSIFDIKSVEGRPSPQTPW